MSKNLKPNKSTLEEQLFSLQRTVQTLVIIMFVLVIAIAGLFLKDSSLFKKPTTTVTTGQQQAPAPTASLASIKELYKKGNIYFGNKDAKNLFVEVADPSCPWCHVAAGHNPELNAEIRPDGSLKLESEGGPYAAPVVKMKELVDSGDAAFVWIYQNGHGNGEMGTKAFYCGFEAGKFWEVHDRLMSNEGYNLLNNVIQNDKAKSGELTDFLAEVVDYDTMKSCLDSGKYDAQIAEDAALAASLGVSGTPGFFINTTRFDGAYSWNDMKSALK